MSWTIEIARSAVKELGRIEPVARRRILVAIQGFAHEPRPVGCKKLAGREGWRIRVGDYRVIYEIYEQVLRVAVIEVGHRRDIYR